jgi:tetratricopeptide (TPR) repeat protein
MRSLGLALSVAAALALVAMPAFAAQDDPRLAALFATLKSTPSADDAKATEAQIWEIWGENKDAETARLMQHGIAAMTEDDTDAALEAFDEAIKRDAHFAEAWNKRATIEFAMGDFQASVADIEHTLALEPRHFGALAGLGQIYLALDRKKAALKAFRAALAINPHLHGVRLKIEELEKDVEGDPI